MSFPTIPLDVQNWLESKFKDEVSSRALEESGEDKAPNINGFNFSLIIVG